MHERDKLQFFRLRLSICFLGKGDTMNRRAIVVGVFVAAVGCALAIVAVNSRPSSPPIHNVYPIYVATEEYSTSDTPTSTFTHSTTRSSVLAEMPGPDEVWVAVHSIHGSGGSATVADPVDSGGNLSLLLAKFAKVFHHGLTIHLGPGVFYGDRLVYPRSNWKIRGAGRDITIWRTTPNAAAVDTIGFRADETNGGLTGVEVSDMTFDFNVPNLRKANRAFVYFVGGKPLVYYYYSQSPPPAWSDKQPYKRATDAAVTYKGAEYVCITADVPAVGKEPAQNDLWSILRPCDPAKLPAWDKGKAYAIGDAVALADKGYICVAANAKSTPSADAADWRPIRTDAPDPRIYTHAVFVNGAAPRGGHRVNRCKAINGHGSSFLGRESFIFGLGGNDCAIEDCQVADFQGDYGSLIVVYCGQNNVVRNCSVRGNGGIGTMAYGGWAVHDCVYENNFCDNVSAANNIDSLTCRNVTYRGNTFLRCHYVGLLVNVSGKYPDEHKLSVNGTVIDTATNQVDGLFIHDNLVEVTDDCPYGGIQVQQTGLCNVKIYNNVIRTHDGKGHGRRAIGVLGNPAANVQITDNTCDPDMYCEIGVPAFGWGNFDLTGKPIKGLEKVTKPGQP
jgi:chitodextrinase